MRFSAAMWFLFLIGALALIFRLQEFRVAEEHRPVLIVVALCASALCGYVASGRRAEGLHLYWALTFAALSLYTGTFRPRLASQPLWQVLMFSGILGAAAGSGLGHVMYLRANEKNSGKDA
jgi:peptidoglycan/LPS O-acetylase OafA/YrhL